MMKRCTKLQIFDRDTVTGYRYCQIDADCEMRTLASITAGSSGFETGAKQPLLLKEFLSLTKEYIFVGFVQAIICTNTANIFLFHSVCFISFYSFLR